MSYLVVDRIAENNKRNVWKSFKTASAAHKYIGRSALYLVVSADNPECGYLWGDMIYPIVDKNGSIVAQTR